MRKLTLILSLCFVACLTVTLASSASAQQIYGDYIESRNADIYTGHCFAMSEVNLMGDQAIVGWHVSKGEWNHLHQPLALRLSKGEWVDLRQPFALSCRTANGITYVNRSP